MKKCMIIFIMCLCTCNVFAQLRNPVVLMPNNVEIPLYENALDDKRSYTIMQDSINEIYFAMDVLEDSPLRFKVRVLMGINENYTPEIVGWIDKKYCGVFPRCYYTEDLKRYIKLFSEPNVSSECKEIYEEDGEYLQSLIPYYTVTSYVHGEWVEVAFYYKGVLYTGWVNKYCPDIYDSCT